MAEEMTEFTSMQILTQAGISMLAQAKSISIVSNMALSNFH